MKNKTAPTARGAVFIITTALPLQASMSLSIY